MSEIYIRTAEGDDSPAICLDNLDGKCKLGQRCRRVHSQTPYLWQSKLGDEWHDMPQIHIEELEKAYSIFYKDEVKLSSEDKSTSERYFPDEVVCFVNFNRMTMTFGSRVIRIRRLSTVSDKQSPHKLATNYAWYFKDDDNTWTKYREHNAKSSKKMTSITSEDIEIAFCRGKQTLQVSTKRFRYVIDFEAMQQINQDTQETRELRRRPCGVGAHCDDQTTHSSKAQSDPVVTYEWQFLDGGKWTTFELDGDRSPGGLSLSQKIEKQFQQNPDSAFDYKSNRNKYVIDFREKILSNLTTGSTMKVRRVPRNMSKTGHERNQERQRNAAMGRGRSSFDEDTGSEDSDEHSRYSGPRNRERKFEQENSSSTDYSKSRRGQNVRKRTTVRNEKSHQRQNNSGSYQDVDNSSDDTDGEDFPHDSHRQSNCESSSVSDSSQESTEDEKSVKQKKTGMKKKKSNEPVYEWLYRDRKGNWIRYGSSKKDIISSEELETRFQRNPDQSIDIFSGKTKYVIDFADKTQKNERTKSKMAIRRRIANTSNAGKKQPSHPKSPESSNSDDASSDASDESVPRYEWSFLDDNGAWVKFGEMISGNDKNCLTTTSDDIEQSYIKDPTKKINLGKKKDKFVLDLQAMTQKNLKTGIVTPLRRTIFKNDTQSSKTKRSNNSSAANDKFEWFFLDGKKRWIRFGDTNSGDASYATNLTSDDIEKHYLQNPNKPLDIENKHNKYILDFQSMTQINKQTKVARAVWRTTANNAQPKPNSMKPTSHQSASSGSKYAWYFQNDKNGWTKFGDSSSGDPSFATNLSSDDIEKHYLQNPTTPLHVENQFNKYVLDLVKMTQMNKKSKVLRPLWRTTADNNKSTMGSSSDDEEYEWFFQDDKNNWTKFGESSSGDRSHATNLTSRDIEKHYQSNKFKPLDIENQHNKYVLDLNKMTQTNKTTHVARPLWRTNARIKDSGSSGQGATVVNHNDDKQSLTGKIFNVLTGVFKSGSTNAEYEWFFMDDQGNWVKYDISYTFNSRYTIKTTSQDIEKAFQSDKSKPFQFNGNNHSYVLDFINMTQTNMQTNKVRAISRLLTNTSLIKKKTAGSSNQTSTNDQQNSKPAQYEWFFMDDQDSWVKYNISSTDSSGNAISITSRDIENAFQTDQSKPFNINGNNHSYVLDFKSMTQTNKQTNTVRAISRVLQNTSLIKKNTTSSSNQTSAAKKVAALYEWYFLDDKNNWIKYGAVSTGQDSSCVTQCTSDDIERFYNENPGQTFDIQSSKHSYVLDFQKMTQTNKNTNAVRTIQRVRANTQPSASKNAVSATAAAYEWFFLDENNSWIKYGQVSSSNDSSLVTTTTSDDIEKQYNIDSSQCFDIHSSHHSYTIDFKNMTQTNKNTNVVRQIKRVQTTNHPSSSSTVSAQSSFSALSAGLSSLYRQSLRNRYASLTVKQSVMKYEWFFLDEQNSWIKYGQVSSSNDSSLVTTTTSDDIEKQFNKDPNKQFDIQSSRNSYTIDFQNMTQTNKKTNVVRKIKREQTKSLNNSSSPSLGNTLHYEWCFQDDQNNWIKYGQPSSSNDSSCITSETSDDIEKQFLQDPHKKMTIKSKHHSYELDFQNMIQTNVSTKVIRNIRRSVAIKSGTSNIHVQAVAFPSHWTNVNIDALTTVTLQQTDKEYQTHLSYMKKTLNNITVVKMVRIQNPHLWVAFLNKKNQLMTANPTIRYKEKYLFHGTDRANIKPICQNNFDWRLAGTSTGNLYGLGAYFSNRASYSDGYTKSSPKCLFIVKVLIGKTSKGNSSVRRPANNCDTSVDDDSNPSIFVKYDTQEYYPEYYVEYN